jgi:GTPase SAR1 family protein
LETECYSGNIKLAMSHVVPDLVQKILIVGENQTGKTSIISEFMQYDGD